jgi:hypothetical protein
MASGFSPVIIYLTILYAVEVFVSCENGESERIWEKEVMAYSKALS